MSEKWVQAPDGGPITLGVNQKQISEGTTVTQFHEGQEVEVARFDESGGPFWRKAKIVVQWSQIEGAPDHYQVEFPDGTRAMFDADHIRPVFAYAAPLTIYDE